MYLGDSLISGAPFPVVWPQQGSRVQLAGLFWALLLHLLQETELVTPTTTHTGLLC